MSDYKKISDGHRARLRHSLTEKKNPQVVKLLNLTSATPWKWNKQEQLYVEAEI